MSKAIQTAEVTWQCIDGIEIPSSTHFEDIYFSKDNGLQESRHVYLQANDLPERLSQLKDYQYFSVAEIGFGTGLNVLALWQLWQQIRPENHSHLHVVSFEKYPLNNADLIRALNAWPELKPWSDQLLQSYPLAISGGHRLHFPEARFSIDLWFGDALENLQQLPKQHPIDAWFLDGFSPKLNPDLWQSQLLKQLVRLSGVGTTLSSFSVAGHFRRSLVELGFNVTLSPGFGHKRQMLKAMIDPKDALSIHAHTSDPQDQSVQINPSVYKQSHIAIIGAGIAGLSCAYALAQRGHKVMLYDQSGPISGASGNPLALLNPRLNPIEKIDDHLMTVSWKFALNHYPKFKAYTPVAVNQFVLKNPEESIQLAQEYPENIFSYYDSQHLQSEQHLNTDYDALCFHQAATVKPEQFKDEVLAHPLIHYVQMRIDRIDENLNDITLYTEDECIQQVDHVIVCCALNSPLFFDYYPAMKPNRGQVSWMKLDQALFDLKHAQSYGGYCAQMDEHQLILGASFFPNRADDEICIEDHHHNHELFKVVFPQQARQLPAIESWEGRASVRAQSLDYFPLVGKLDLTSKIFTLSGLGSKGYLYAPLCAEIIISEILNEVCPVNVDILKKINPRRFIKKVKPKKPYYQKPTES